MIEPSWGITVNIWSKIFHILYLFIGEMIKFSKLWLNRNSFSQLYWSTFHSLTSYAFCIFITCSIETFFNILIEIFLGHSLWKWAYWVYIHTKYMFFPSIFYPNSISRVKSLYSCIINCCILRVILPGCLYSFKIFHIFDGFD